MSASKTNNKSLTVMKYGNLGAKMPITFEQFIMNVCGSSESVLRRWLKEVLPKYGFSIIEDEFVSERAKENPNYKEVHNLLAIRGTPRVCLVAHTDVCRDHKEKIDYVGETHSSSPSGKKVEPVIKEVELKIGDVNCLRKVIQDKNCELQVGGDDRLGVAINLWVALHTSYDLGLLFTTDEEIGLKSAREVKFKEMNSFDLCVQVDRGNHSNELVTKISNIVICDYDNALKLLEIAYDIGLPRKPVVGMSTDVAAMKEKGVIKNAVNMTCGYHHSHGPSPHEYIDIEEAKDTCKYVSSIVKSYELEKLCKNKSAAGSQEEEEDSHS